jgi:hypothetical protein
MAKEQHSHWKRFNSDGTLTKREESAARDSSSRSDRDDTTDAPSPGALAFARVLARLAARQDFASTSQNKDDHNDTRDQPAGAPPHDQGGRKPAANV